MANKELKSIKFPTLEDTYIVPPDLSAEVTALQGAVSTLNTDVSNIPNGTYPNLTAGSILTNKYDTDTLPYLYRAMPYVSKRLEDVLVGGSVVWNQLVDPQKRNYTPFSANGITIYYNNDGTWTINGTATAATSYLFTTPFNGIIGHKYLAFGYVKVGSNTGSFGFAGTSTDKGNGGIFNFADGYTNIRLNINSGDSFSNTIMRPVVIDLTAFFASATVADAIYTMEQNTAGSGVAFMRKYFPKLFSAEYDAGTLKSVNPTAHVTRGVNAWDGTKNDGAYWSDAGVLTDYGYNSCTSKIRVLPNEPYYFHDASATITVKWFTENMELISKQDITAGASLRIYTSPSNAYYVTVNHNGSTFPTEWCINISDPTINGKYFPYEEHTYDLGDVTLRGIPKLVNNELVYDGDIYTHDGSVTRRFAVVTVNGSENWTKSSTYNGNYYLSHGAEGGKTSTQNIMTSNGLIPVAYASELSSNDMCVMIDGGAAYTLNIKNTSKTTLTDFKSWLADNPITVVYELATPTTETSTPFEQYQICTTGGTEEYTTTNDVPVGHDTKYFTDVIGNIEDIPAPPTADGTYTLKVTVSSGVPTYAWV